MTATWRRWARRLLALALAGLVPACALPVGEMSPEQEVALGRQEAAKVAQQVGLVESPELAAYVASVGERIARHAPRQEVPWTFHVADMEEPNAFALPGGFIYVSRGLLVLTNDEDELANVIGHEIAHVVARHHAGRQSRATSVGLLAVLGTVAAAVLGGSEAAQLAQQIAQIAGTGVIAAYTRDQEREADRLGQQLALRAGYDPAAMPRFLRTLDGWVRLHEGRARGPSFFDTHPSTPERIAASQRLARELAPGGVPGDPRSRERLLSHLDGLVVGEDPAGGVVRDGTFLHPDLGFALAFPRGWRVQNTRTVLGAVSPAQDALLKLEVQGPGSDPRAAAVAYARESGLRYARAGPLSGARVPAFRAVAVADTQQGRLALDLVWLAWEGSIYRLTGITPAGEHTRLAPVFEAVAQSFRPLTDVERASFTVTRLRIVRAQPGESLAALSARAGNVWPLAELALVNGLSPDARLPGGAWVKVARAERYRGAR